MATDYFDRRATLRRSSANERIRGSASPAAGPVHCGPVGKASSDPSRPGVPFDDLGKRLRDRIEPGVRVLFVGINPGVRSALTGHHFAGFSNRFWKLLFDAKLVPEPITYRDDVRLPEWGFGITNVVPRATPGIDTLRPEEYRQGTRTLLRKVGRYRPSVLALVGVTVWRAVLEGAGAPAAKTRPVVLGLQRRGDLDPGVAQRIPAETRIFVLPNPSGRNANYSYAEMLRVFKKLKDAI